MRGRLPGHTLKAEGAAYKYIQPLLVAGGKGRWVYDFAGSGHGMCECGWVSELLTSNNKRKAAHREHKAEEVASQGLIDWTPARVERVISIFGLDATGFWANGGDLRVTMSFRDLCSFIEAICGSMSEANLDGLVAEDLFLRLKTIEAND